MRIAPTLATLLALTASGCDSSRDAKLQEDQRNFDAVVQAQKDVLQWRIDDSTAMQVFDGDTDAGVKQYLTFRKCHEEPPTHPANQRVCAALQARIAKREAFNEAKTRTEKAAW